MKNLILIIVSCLLCFSCSSNKINKRAVTYNYTNVSFDPTQKKNYISSDMILNVEPIDAAKLNNEIYEASKRDGSYEKSYMYQKDLMIEQSNLNNKDKKQIEMFLKIFNTLDEMVYNNVISNEVAQKFKDKIYYTFTTNKSYGWDGSEQEINLENDRFSELNPYKIGNRYFSMFKLTFANKSDKIQKFDINNFQILSENELLYPFKNEYFETSLGKQSVQLNYIYRMNMPNSLSVIPNQTSIKYISIPAINTDNKEVNVSYINNENAINYLFSVTPEKKTKEVIFTLFTIKQDFPSCIYVIEQKNGMIFPLKNDYFYINDNDINDNKTSYRRTRDRESSFRIYAIVIENSNKLKYSIGSFFSSQVKGKKIKLKYNEFKPTNLRKGKNY